MSKLEEALQRFRDNAKDGIEHMEIGMEYTDPDRPFVRLELLYDRTKNVILLQGNVAGLQVLLHLVGRLVTDKGRAHGHYHFDKVTNLTFANTEMIIQRVEDQGPGSHTVEDASMMP